MINQSPVRAICRIVNWPVSTLNVLSRLGIKCPKNESKNIDSLKNFLGTLDRSKLEQILSILRKNNE